MKVKALTPRPPLPNASLGGGESFCAKAHGGGLHITGEAGGYEVNDGRYAPDVAVLSKDKQAELSQEGYNPMPPDLAVEIEFPTYTQSERRLRFKLLNYLSVGTVVWVVYPETKEAEVYESSEKGMLLGIDDTIQGIGLLEGFSMPVREVFGD